MAKKKHPQPPFWLLAAAATRAQAMDERELALKNRYRYEQQTRWQTLRTGIQTHFLLNYAPLVETPQIMQDMPPRLEPTWDMPTARRLDTMGGFEEALDEQVDDIGELVDGYEEDADDAAREGYLSGLWLMDQQGVETKKPKRRSLWGLALGLAAFGGLSFRQRADQWLNSYKDKATRTFRASLAGGLPLQDTLTTLDRLNTQTEAHISEMLGEELYYAYLHGETEAFKDFEGNLFGELWVTREDELVCPICEPLHLTLTALIPIQDTHPRCRCWKVPLAMALSYNPSVYETFVASLPEEDLAEEDDIMSDVDPADLEDYS